MTGKSRKVTRKRIVKESLQLHNLFNIWDEFTTRYEAAEASLRTYKQKYEIFLKWVLEQNKLSEKLPLRNLEDITRDIAEDYARYVYKRKTTAKKDIENLKRIWTVMLPDEERNPWNIGLHLRTPLPKSPCNYRPLTVDEARRFIAKARECAEKGDPCSTIADGRYTSGSDKFLDLADAAIFAWHYGMRIGSLVSLHWKELATYRQGYFLHIPPKTRHSKPWPLEIPIVSEVREVLVRREKGFGGKPCGFLFPDLAKEHKRSAPNLTSSIKCLFTAAGIRNNHKGRSQMHSFRASFITQMDEAGAPTGITDAITGHAPKTVHDRYSHARADALKRWLDKAIPNLIRDE